MGDLCDKKDFHSATLVNKLVDALMVLEPPVYIIKGNHDYTDPTNPFFGFLNFMEGIKFVSHPLFVTHAGTGVAIMPHTPSEEAFDANCRGFARHRPDLFLCHQTFDGAIAESGARLAGFSQAPISFLKPRLGAYAGDVHRPQRSNDVVYVGAPYHIKFGDNFTPRSIYLNESGNPTDLYFDTLRKWALSVRDADEILGNKELLPGDQVKLTVELAREEAVDWKAHKAKVIEALKRKEVQIFGIDLKVNTSTPKKQIISGAASRDHGDVLAAFCRAENVASQTKQAGEKILKQRADVQHR
jgi:hypothetical protein